MAVERSEEDFAVVVSKAARHHIAAGDALRGGIGFRRIRPLEITACGVEREHLVRMYARIRPNDEDGAIDGERRGLLPARGVYRERPGQSKLPDVAGINLVETAEARVGVIFGGHWPLLVVLHQRLDGTLDRRGAGRRDRPSRQRVSGRRILCRCRAGEQDGQCDIGQQSHASRARVAQTFGAGHPSNLPIHCRGCDAWAAICAARCIRLRVSAT